MLPLRKLVLTPLIIMSLTLMAKGEGQYADPAISNATVSTTGTWTCHINDTNDKVEMSASATDYDCAGGPPGDRINLAATQWSVPAGWGTLQHQTGASNNWTAGAQKGQTTLTVTFHDLDDGADYDDDGEPVQKQLTAFRVGAHLGTSAGSSLTKWENSNVEPRGLGGSLNADHILTTSNHTDGDNSEATWSLRVDPDQTPIKGNIRAWAGAWGAQGRIRGVVADSDWDVGGGGDASMSVTLSLGIVSFSYTQSLSGDDNLSLLSVGYGFASQLHTDASDEIELISSTTTGPSETKGISHSPDDAAIVGKPEASKRAEWEVGHKLQRKLDGSNWAAAECEANMNYGWLLTGTLPVYLPAGP